MKISITEPRIQHLKLYTAKAMPGHTEHPAMTLIKEVRFDTILTQKMF